MTSKYDWPNPTQSRLRDRLNKQAAKLNYALDHGANAEEIAVLRQSMTETRDMHHYLYGPVNCQAQVKRGKQRASGNKPKMLRTLGMR